MHGRRLPPGAPSPHEEFLLNTAPGGGAIRVGQWELVLKGSADDGEAGDGGAEPGTRLADGAGTSEELFRLDEDPNEKHDLATTYPEKVKEFRQRYDALARQAVKFVEVRHGSEDSFRLETRQPLRFGGGSIRA
jgi:arylsulfatase A-like enzyme